MKRILFLFIVFVNYSSAKSQTLKVSVYSEVSVITVGPSDVLYESFGHSAIRIKDPLLRLDLVYNYGMFDFNAPNFYTNFANGKLLYKLARYPFHYFEKSNIDDKRWMKEQVLKLTQQEKQAFFDILENNARPENASYLYDPFFNNCASKIRDITQEVLDNKVVFSDNYVKEEKSLRQLMNSKLYWNTWGSFGINLALGTKLDKVASAEEHMYLPDYIYQAFQYATYEGKSLVKEEKTLLDFKKLKTTSSLWSPLNIFSILFLLILSVSIKDVRRNKISTYVDNFVLSITGFAGIIIMYLWFFTDHSTTPDNYNILWAFPLNLLMILVFSQKKNINIKKRFYIVNMLLLLILIIIWIARIQLFNLALIPILLIIAIRGFVNVKLLSFKE